MDRAPRAAHARRASYEWAVTQAVATPSALREAVLTATLKLATRVVKLAIVAVGLLAAQPVLRVALQVVVDVRRND